MREDRIQKIIEKEKLINNTLKNNDVSVKLIKRNGHKGYILVINKSNMVEKELTFEIVSSCQIKIMENKRILERGLYIDKLDAWFYNLYNPVKYLYTFHGGRLHGKVLTRGQMNRISNEKTLNFRREREMGLLVHREELDDQPKVIDYLGPMYNGFTYGVIYLRYETQEVYDMLST